VVYAQAAIHAQPRRPCPTQGSRRGKGGHTPGSGTSNEERLTIELRPGGTECVGDSGCAGSTKEIVMPTGKDLKRLVRARMEKTGESYTAARAQILNKHKVVSAVRRTAQVRLKPDTTGYVKIAGMSDASVKKATGCTWERWVKA